MTDENITGPAAGADENAPATDAARPARKRARRAVADPGSRAPVADAPAAPAAEAPAAEADAPAKAAPKRTTTRKAPAARSTTRRPKAEQAEVEAAAPAEVPAATEAPATTEAPAAAEPAPAKAPARRRSTRAKAAPAAETTDQTTQAPGPDAAATEPTESAPAARTTRSAGTRKRSPKAAASAPAPAQEAAQAAEEAGAAEETTSARVGGTTRLATTALLFQAPELTAARRRRRRAEAPAGPPRPAEDEEPTTEDAPAEELEDAEATDATPITEETEAAAETTDTDESAEDGEAGDGTEEGGASGGARRRRRRGGRGRRGRSGGGAQADAEKAEGDKDEDGEAPEGGEPATDTEAGEDGETAETTEGAEGEATDGEGTSSSRRRRRRRRSRGEGGGGEEPAGEPRRARTDEVTALKGSTRLEAKRQRRREGRDAGRRRTVITEAEFLARRESVDRTMVVREQGGRVQIAILEDGVLVEHYVSRTSQTAQAPMAGNVYLGRVQNVLPSMEAAFVDIGKGRNAVLYAGEVNWDAAGLEGQPRRIEQALKSGDSVLVQVTKEPVGHKGARLTSQITLAGRYLVYVPGGGMTGISRKLPEPERARLKKILREIVPDDAGVIVRTAAEGASDEELRRDVQRLQDQWAAIQKKAATATPPSLLQGEPDLAIRVVRDVFNDDFNSLVVQGENAWNTVWDYVQAMAPDLVGKVSRWAEDRDVFAAHRVDEQIAKAMDRKVWLPSGGSLVIDRTEAMTVIDVNTGKFTGSGGTLEETVTRNNLEAAEEIVRQLRLRDIGGIIVIDFIDMVLESNRDLVLRRLVECLGRDRTKHQVAEVTSLGLVQMTRKRVGQGLFEAFSEQCAHCGGRGYLIHNEPVSRSGGEPAPAPAEPAEPKKSRRKRAAAAPVTTPPAGVPVVPVLPEAREAVKATLATIAAAAAHAHAHDGEGDEADGAAPAEAAAVPDPGTTDLLDALASIAASESAPAEPAGQAEQAEADGVPATEATEPSAAAEPAEATASEEAATSVVPDAPDAATEPAAGEGDGGDPREV